MKNRKAKLEKALACPEEANEPGPFYYGVKLENARLAPLHEVLIEAVEALEKIENTYDYFRLHEQLVKEALSKIDKALEEM